MKINANDGFNRMWTAGWLGTLIACSFCAVTLQVAAQDSGLGTAQGRMSAGEQTQAGETTATDEGQPMPGSDIDQRQLSLAAGDTATQSGISINDENTMENLLGQNTVQPPVENTFGADFDGVAEQITQEQTMSEEQQQALAQGETFLVLVLEISQDGSSEVLSATEMVGSAALSDEALSDFLVEVSDSGETLGIQSLPADPFEAHSFGGSPGNTAGHHFQKLEKTTLTLKVPKRSLDSSFEGMTLDLLRLGAGPQVELFSPAAVADLKQAQRLKSVISISGSDISEAVKEKGTRLVE